MELIAKFPPVIMVTTPLALIPPLNIRLHLTTRMENQSLPEIAEYIHNQPKKT